MSDLVENSEDRFSRVAAQLDLGTFDYHCYLKRLNILFIDKIIIDFVFLSRKILHFTLHIYIYIYIYIYGPLSKNGAIQKGKTKKINCPFFLF